ncbi:TonB-dependent receptor [Tunturiibacter gelidoferens]|uniref:TonB-dependent receptor n=1 Tax=Tunturiibacter lichenicola TaxID=2051959 RepID=A0A7Y9T6K8_9BACT|nr:TonB-dependent receptor [Edaphobacter lichenicola]NYF53444.1 TonB-dependent receptor [Edaphobacter lichenicola]
MSLGNHAKQFAVSVFMFLFICVLSAGAQTGIGLLSGSVVDSQGGALQGAKVEVNPGAASTLSDAQGQFTLNGLTAGDHDVTVSYAGFAPFTKKVTVVSGQVVRLAASLTVASNKQDVQVYAGREGGEIESINRTFNADNIINVLPADVIKSLPNANVADALGRLASVTLERDEGEGKYVQVRGTEPRLTNVTIDGVNIASAETVRQIKLDIIPADLVESVQINKTLEASMPGDGIGGSVDLRTKSAGDRPTVALESTGGYTPIIGGRTAYQFDGTLGKRFLEGNKLGLLFGGSYDWNGRGINDVEPAPVLLGGYDQRDYQYYRSRTGYAGTVDYRFNETSSIYLKGLYSLFHNFGNRWDYNVATTYTADGQPDGTGTTTFGAEIRRPVQDLGSLQLGGRHVIRRSLLSWDVESSVGRTRDRGYSDATFAPGADSVLNGGIQFSLDHSNPLTPKLVAPSDVNIFDPTQYYYAGQRVDHYYNPEVDLGFGADLATNYTFFGHASSFEFGGRFRNVHKFANEDVTYTVPVAAANDPSLQMTNFLNGFKDPNYYGGTYQFGPAVDYQKVQAYNATSPQMPDPNNPSIQTNNFNLIEKVSAGYLMDTVTLNKFRIIVGLRFENTSDTDKGNVTPDSPPVARSGSYLDVLPSGSVRYSLTPLSGIRLVYGRGVSRPNFSDLVSFASISPGGVRTTSSVGNPALKPEHADNVDLLYERSLNPIGLLQAGVYYKHLSDPIIPLQTTLADGTIQTQPQNAGSAYVYGFEISFQQHFTYLPGLLNGTGLSANYGYSASQVTFPGLLYPNGSPTGISRTDKPDLLRQSPNTWNISPTYDKRNLSVRLGLSYNAANIFSYQYSDSNAGPIVFTQKKPNDTNTGYLASGGGIKGPNGDTYLYGHLQVDLQGSYRLPKGFTAVAYALNLNNEVFGFYNGSTVNPIQREFYKQTFGGGLRWSPSRER